MLPNDRHQIQPTLKLSYFKHDCDRERLTISWLPGHSLSTSSVFNSYDRKIGLRAIEREGNLRRQGLGRSRSPDVHPIRLILSHRGSSAGQRDQNLLTTYYQHESVSELYNGRTMKDEMISWLTVFHKVFYFV